MSTQPGSSRCSVRLTSGERVAVGTVFALGRNFAEHAREMDAPPEPVVFLKPATSVLPGGGTVAWPFGSHEVHHEVELVLLLGDAGRDLDRESARRAISALAVGVDLTARDLQTEAKRRGGPWARSKGFPGAAPVSAFLPLENLPVDMNEIDLRLDVGGRDRQVAMVSEMLLDPPAIVVLLSRWFDLRRGDLIFTGTPAGVGPLSPGEPVTAESRALSLSVAFSLARPAGPGP
ncbi:MAG: fumarylacetoacetate hydrolase family protein [Acidobacteriota bacterium]|nr:fumarylacetoacetate hydrolase family protein [Acidobacteriota bacterium]